MASRHPPLNPSGVDPRERIVDQVGLRLGRSLRRLPVPSDRVGEAVEHVFAHQKNRFGLFVRTIGLTRAEAKLTLANIAYNFDRLIFQERRQATG